MGHSSPGMPPLLGRGKRHPVHSLALTKDPGHGNRACDQKVQRAQGLRTIWGRACLDGDRRAAVAPGAGEEGEGPGGQLQMNQGQVQTPRNSRPPQMLPLNHGDCGPPDDFCN